MIEMNVAVAVQEDEVEQQRQNVPVENGVVVLAYAVVDPVAVVVEFADALVTNVAVPQVAGVHCFAIGAKHVGVHLLHHLLELDVLLLLHEAWVSEGGHEEAGVDEDKVDVQEQGPFVEGLIRQDEHVKLDVGPDYQGQVAQRWTSVLLQLLERRLELRAGNADGLRSQDVDQIVPLRWVLRVVDDVVRGSTLVVFDISARSFDEHLLQGPQVRKVKDVLNGYVERSLTFVVLMVDQLNPGKQVVDGLVSTVAACQVQRGLPILV